MRNLRNIFAALICLSLFLGINAIAAPSAVNVTDTAAHFDDMAGLFEDTATESHTHKICGDASCTDENHSGHETDIVYTPITQASTHDGVTVTMSGEKYRFTLTGGTADAYNVYNFYVDEDVTFWGNSSNPAIKVPAYTTLNICLNGNVIKCDTYDFILTTSSGFADINLCDCSEGVVHHGYLNSSTGNVWVQGEEVPEGCTELDLEGGVIQGYWTSTTSSSYSSKGLVHLYSLSSDTTPVTFNMYGGNIAGHYRYGVYARKYTTVNFYDGTIAGNRCGINSSTAGATINMYGGTVSHHIGDTYFGIGVAVDNTFNMYGGEICYNENYGTGTNRGGGIQNYGIVNIYDGSIHHNNSATHGGAVYNTGDLYMYGGSMTYNSADTGSAVYNYGGKTEGAFTMTGGSITNNTTLSTMNYCRGAVWLRPGDPSTMFGGGGTFIVSGTPVVKDNVDILGRAADVFVGTSQWEGKTRISVGALEEGAEIGVFVYKQDGLITYNWTANMGSADPNDYFFANHNTEYSVFSVDAESGELYLDICDHDGERTYEAQTGSYHFFTCSICNEKIDETHTETTPADCLNLAYCAVCDSEYGSYSQSNHHESCTISYTYYNANYHTSTWSACGYSYTSLHTKTTAANCTYANYCGVCDSYYGSVSKSNHIEDENHTCTICGKTASASVLLDGETEPTYYIELNAAFDAVEGKATITLLRDIDELLSDCDVDDGDDITLDFNGHNITNSSSYGFNVTKSKQTVYDFARLTVIGSGKLTYSRAGSSSYVYSPFAVSAQQNSAATGLGFPELIIGGDIIIESTGNYAVPVNVGSNNAAVTSHFTLKDNAKLISNYLGGVVYYDEPASARLQGGINIFIEGGSLVNNAGTTLVGHNASSRYYDGTLANVYIDVPGIVSSIPNTYYLISHNLAKPNGTLSFTNGATVVNEKNYALADTDVSFTITENEGYIMTDVEANGIALTDADGVYTFTTADDVSFIKVNGNVITLDIGERSSEANIRFAEINGIQTQITENENTYSVPVGDDNLLIEIVEKTSADTPEIVKSQYFYVDMSNKTYIKLNMDSYMTTDGKKSIRTKTPMGIRFRYGALTSAKQEESEYVINEIGFIVAVTDSLGENELTLDYSKYVSGVAYNRQENVNLVFDRSDDSVDVFTCVVKNLPVERYKTNLTCKTYTRITVSGQEFIVYGEAVVGNIYDTAQKLLESNPDDSTLTGIISDYDNSIA